MLGAHHFNLVPKQSTTATNIPLKPPYEVTNSTQMIILQINTPVGLFVCQWLLLFIKMARLLNFLYDEDWESSFGVHFGIGVLMHTVFRFSGANVLMTMTITIMKSTMTTMMMMTTTTIMI